VIPCLLTFDVEDWFQVENLRPTFPPECWAAMPRRVAGGTRVILRLLAEHGVHATFFVLGWVAEREPALVTPAQFRDDVVRARRVLEAISGREVIGYRAPSFSIDRERLAIAGECGFRYDSSHHPFRLHDRYGRLGDLGVPLRPGVYRLTGEIVEVRLPVEQLGPLPIPVSGGGYFRLYPGPLFRSLTRRFIARRGYYAMYLHSWEFDPAQPRVREAGLGRTFRHYNGLSRTVPRLRKLIEMLNAADARFVTMREFLGGLVGESAPAAGRTA